MVFVPQGTPQYVSPVGITDQWPFLQFLLSRTIASILRTNDKKAGPGPELLTPCPTLHLKGLKHGAMLGKIIATLGTEGQDAGFLHRTPGGDS